jgi:hypothetical protein
MDRPRAAEVLLSQAANETNPPVRIRMLGIPVIWNHPHLRTTLMRMSASCDLLTASDAKTELRLLGDK